MKYSSLLLSLLLCLFSAFGQVDSMLLSRLKAIEQNNNLQSDTITPPADELTGKILQLRREKGGISIETLLKMKMADLVKDTTRPAAYYVQLKEEMTSGRTARWISNCVVNLYRRNYNESEIDELLRFFRTPAGQKYNSEQVFIILQSVKDAESLMNMAESEVGSRFQKKK